MTAVTWQRVLALIAGALAVLALVGIGQPSILLGVAVLLLAIIAIAT